MTRSVFLILFSLFASLHGHGDLRVLSTSPRIYYVSDFLSDKECKYLIKEARPHLQRSTVLGAKGGVVDPRRTSYGMFFPLNPSDKTLRSIEKRIAQLTHLPIENGEAMQVLHYETGGEYQPHFDYFNPSHPGGAEALGRGGQRVASVILYLNTPERGGETIFPKLHISVTPKKGDALFFYNVTPEGRPDPQTLHGGAPVLQGEKWILNKWFRESRFR